MHAKELEKIRNVSFEGGAEVCAACLAYVRVVTWAFEKRSHIIVIWTTILLF